MPGSLPLDPSLKRMLPFLDGSDAAHAAVRSLFVTAGFTSQNVEKRIGIDDIHAFKPIGEGRKQSTGLDDALDVLVRLFMDGVAVPMAKVRAMLPEGGEAALLDLGLIAPHPDAPDEYAAGLRIYPIDGVYIASDLEWTTPGLRQPEELEPPDHVFSALTSLTGTFLDQLPKTPCDRFLELCAGTGVAALIASRFSGHTWSADITERSTAFARFNARLNGIGNFTAVCGDLYEAVAGQTFDRIVAHPPYVPAPENEMIYRDGGEDGEWIIRRILSGLNDHLAPGGRFYLTCATSDRRDAPVEDRIRAMIGEAEKEFDLLVVVHYALPPGEMYGRLAVSRRVEFETALQRIELFRELDAERIVYCSIILQRRATDRAPFTIRRERTEASRAAEAEWLMNWCTRCAEEDVVPMLLDARPRLLSIPRLEVTHRVENGEWKVATSKIVTEYPFLRTVEISLNGAMLLSLCDGNHTGREVFARVRAGGAMPQEVPESAFAEFLRELVTEGIIGFGEEPVAPVPSAGPVKPLPTP